MTQKTRNLTGNYLRAELIRGLKLIPSFGLAMLLTGAAILVAAVLFCAFSEEHELFPKATVAIVMEEPDLKTTAAVKLVESMESVSSVVSFTLPTREDAERKLENGEIAGIIYLGADAYQDINTGVNTPIEIRLSSEAPALSRDTFSSLVRAGVSLIRTTEAAVYAGGEISARAEFSGSTDASGSTKSPAGAEPSGSTNGQKITEDDIFGVYLTYILNRMSLFTTSTHSALGTLSLRQFYLGSGMLLILLLFGTGFARFYTEEEETVTDLLSRDVPFAALDAARILAQLLLLLLAGALLAAILLMVPSLNPAASALSSGARLSLWAGTLPGIAACVFSVAAFWHLLYLLLPSESAPLVSLLITVFLFAFSGGLVPDAYMPAALKALTAFSPVRLWQKCLFSALFGDTSAPYALVSLLAGAAFLAAALLFRLITRRRLSRRYL